MTQILTIGGATQDIFLECQGADIMTIQKKNSSQHFMLFESGEKIEIETLVYLTGGGATNSATSFSRLGFETTCCCVIGNDIAGLSILDVLKKEGVSTSLVHTSLHHKTGVSCIINTVRGDRTIFAFRGANGFLEKKNIPMKQLTDYKQLYITSLSNTSAQILPDIVEQAKQSNIPVAINPGTSQLIKGMKTLKQSLNNIDILILNSNEARMFMTALIEVDDTYKKTLESPSMQNPCGLNLADARPYLLEFPIVCQDQYFSMYNFFKTVLTMGPSIVIVTNGANGVYAATNQTLYFYPSMKVKVTNTVGAGDAFGSCFVASLQLGYTIQDALRNGVINSASVLGHIGAKEGLLTHQQIKDVAQNISPKLLQTFTL